MAFKAVFLIVLACCAAGCVAQVTLPLTYSARELNGTGVGCAPGDQRQAARESISNDVRGLIQGSVLSQLFSNCSCLSGGTRVAYLDMTDPSQQCPSNWTEYQSPRRTCWRSTFSGGCDIASYPTNGITYNRVCGRIVAYQCGTPDGLFLSGVLSPTSFYVDGIAITHGTSTLQHIWTYAATPNTGRLGGSQCPCSGSQNVPTFIGSDYFCDSIPTSLPPSCSTSGTGFLTSRPLWTGQGCLPGSPCCGFSDPPWFCTQLPAPTADDITVRLCGNGLTGGGEDTPIELIEIYVS